MGWSFNFEHWRIGRDAQLDLIQSGKHMEHAFIESFQLALARRMFDGHQLALLAEAQASH